MKKGKPANTKDKKSNFAGKVASIWGFKNYPKEIKFLCTCCAASIVLMLTVINFGQYLSKNQVLGAKSEVIDTLSNKSELNKEVAFWKEFLNNNPTYLEGWLQLANLSYLQGNLEEAKRAIERAYEIDPNSTKVLQVRDSLRI